MMKPVFRTIVRVIAKPTPEKPGVVALDCGHVDTVHLPLGSESVKLEGETVRCSTCGEKADG